MTRRDNVSYAYCELAMPTLLALLVNTKNRLSCENPSGMESSFSGVPDGVTLTRRVKVEVLS
jgi:hypothetical protein